VIVVDTNVITYFFINGDYTQLVEQLLQKDNEWHAPLLWNSEFRNVLTSHMAVKSMGLEKARQLAVKAESLMMGREHSVHSESVLQLASSSKCSAYDCEFVALAQDLDIPLVTTDNRLVKRFPKVAVALKNFVVG
jgi:predicted nucleic acid-binding protein